MDTKPDIAAFTADIDLATSALGKAGSKQASNDTFKLIFSKIKPLGKGYSDFFFTAPFCIANILNRQINTTTHIIMVSGGKIKPLDKRESFFFLQLHFALQTY